MTEKLDPLKGTNLTWMDAPTDVDAAVAIRVIALIALIVTVVVAMFALTAREAPGMTFTCAPGEVYTVKECP